MIKKEIEQIEQVALAALNLLVALGLVNGEYAQLLILSGRHAELAKVLNEKRERVALLAPEPREWLQSVDVLLRKPAAQVPAGLGTAFCLGAHKGCECPACWPLEQPECTQCGYRGKWADEGAGWLQCPACGGI